MSYNPTSCPKETGPCLAPNGARCHRLSLVGTFATLAVTRWRIFDRARHIAPNDAKKRQSTPENANRRRAATARDEKRQEVSRVRSFITPWVRGRASRGNGASRARATFRGAKPITRNGRNASHKRTCSHSAPPAEAPRRARQRIQRPTSTRALRARAARTDDPGARGGGKSDQGTIGCALRWTGNSRD